MNKLLIIFIVFFKLGAFTFGGGLAMIPIIRREIIDRGWIDEDELTDYIAVSQVAPGMIAINIAVLVGGHLAGRKGSLLAVLGVALPSLIIITAIAALLRQFSDILLVVYALRGILVVVVVLLFAAMLDLGKKAIRNVWLLCYAFIGFALIYFLNVSSILIILSAFLFGTIHAWLVYRKRVIS